MSNCSRDLRALRHPAALRSEACVDLAYAARMRPLCAAAESAGVTATQYGEETCERGDLNPQKDRSPEAVWQRKTVKKRR